MKTQLATHIRVAHLGPLLDGIDLGSLLGLVVLDIGDLGAITVEDPGNLLQGRSLGLDVEEVDEDELDSDPDLEEHMS